MDTLVKSLRGLFSRSFIKFTLAGAINSVFLLGMTYFLTSFGGIFYFYSYVISWSIIITSNFMLSVKWIFKVRGNYRKRFLRYIMFLALFTLTNMALVRLLTEVAGLFYLLSIAIVTLSIFLLKYFTYKNKVFNDLP